MPRSHPLPKLPMTQYAIDHGYFDGDFDRLNHNYYHDTSSTFPSSGQRRVLNCAASSPCSLGTRPLPVVRPCSTASRTPVRWFGDLLTVLPQACVAYRSPGGFRSHGCFISFAVPQGSTAGRTPRRARRWRAVRHRREPERSPRQPRTTITAGSGIEVEQLLDHGVEIKSAESGVRGRGADHHAGFGSRTRALHSRREPRTSSIEAQEPGDGSKAPRSCCGCRAESLRRNFPGAATVAARWESCGASPGAFPLPEALPTPTAPRAVRGDYGRPAAIAP